MGVLGKKLAEELVQRHHLRHQQEVALDLAEVVVGAGLLCEDQHVLDVHEPHTVVEVAFHDGKPRVFALNGELQIRVEGLIHIE
jgi:hypothetical protein